MYTNDKTKTRNWNPIAGFRIPSLCLLLFIPKTRQKSRHFKDSATEIRLRPIPRFPTFPGFPTSRKSTSPANRKLSHISHFLCAFALNFPAEPESNQTFGHFHIFQACPQKTTPFSRSESGFRFVPPK